MRHPSQPHPPLLFLSRHVMRALSTDSLFTCNKKTAQFPERFWFPSLGSGVRLEPIFISSRHTDIIALINRALALGGSA